MNTRAFAAVSALVVSCLPGLAAQAPPATRQSGPVIQAYGGTFDVPNAVLMPPADVEYKVKFDVGTPNDDPKQLNTRIDTVARFLNMQARAGVPLDKLKVALVLHTTAAKDALGHAGYRARYGVDNPNLPLLEALDKAGVRIYVCGQSAMSRRLGLDEIAPSAKVAYSAMTAHALLAREGYVTNPF